jgi:hypothetical protein
MNNYFKFFLPILVLLFLRTAYANINEVDAVAVTDSLNISEEYLDVPKNSSVSICSSTIPYPTFAPVENVDPIKNINHEIKRFVYSYSLCHNNMMSNDDEFFVAYDIPDSYVKNYFSIRWITKKNHRLWHIDTLNFDLKTGKVLKIRDIFNKIDYNLVSAISSMSEGYISSDISTADFEHLVVERQIQFYISNQDWYVVFNANNLYNHVFAVQIPRELIQWN